MLDISYQTAILLVYVLAGLSVFLFILLIMAYMHGRTLDKELDGALEQNQLLIEKNKDIEKEFSFKNKTDIKKSKQIQNGVTAKEVAQILQSEQVVDMLTKRVYKKLLELNKQ